MILANLHAVFFNFLACMWFLSCGVSVRENSFALLIDGVRLWEKTTREKNKETKKTFIQISVKE